MKKILPIILIFISNIMWAQSITAEKEYLLDLPLGNGEGLLKYSSTEEGLYSPGAPVIDEKGAIYFYPQLVDFIIVVNNGKVNILDFPRDYPNRGMSNSYPMISQQGFFGYNYHPGDEEYALQQKSSTKGVAGYIYYYMPWGIYCDYKGYSEKRGFGSVEYQSLKFSAISSVKTTYIFRDENETRVWLPSQLGGFSIGIDGLLYRNGMLWSAMNPKEPKYRDGKYLGRIMGGFTLWAYGFNGQECFFSICRPDGTQELEFELPWGISIDRPIKFGEPVPYYNYGLGPWGELYCLVPPLPEMKYDKRTENYWPIWEKGEAELVVVRNHLKYFGRLNDDRVRLRKEPDTTSGIVGTYPNKTGFRILETGSKPETIGGQTAPWYKVRLLDGTEGWFFGAFVHNLYDGPDGSPPPWPNVPDW